MTGDDDRAAARRYLVDLGIDGARIDATPEIRWNHLVQELLYLGGPPTLTIGEVARRASIEVEEVRQVWRNLGAADPGDEVGFRDTDVAMFGLYRDAVALFGQRPVDHFVRAVGAALRRITDAANGLFLESLGAETESLHDWVQLAQLGGDQMVRLADEMVRPVLLRFALESQVFSQSAGAIDAPEVTVAVGFCDLVGSTPLITSVDANVMGQAMIDFEAAALEAALDHGGRVVKFVGDEVMFTTVDVVDAERIATEIVAWAADHEVFTGARAGIAHGTVLFRSGDLYGSVVNLAARLTALADDGTVLVADDRGPDAVELRGFADPVRIRRIAPAR